MSTLKRLLRHLTTTTASGKRAFPVATLTAIEEVIRQGERMHRAEVRLIIETAFGLVDILCKVTARGRAKELFAHCRVWDTEDNCGVLLYINLADRKVEIIADRAINRVVKPEDWRDICDLITRGFRGGVFQDSVIKALATLNSQLQQHFPAHGERTNQLSNTPLIL